MFPDANLLYQDALDWRKWTNLKVFLVRSSCHGHGCAPGNLKPEGRRVTCQLNPERPMGAADVTPAVPTITGQASLILGS